MAECSERRKELEAGRPAERLALQAEELAVRRKREAIQEILRRENELALAPDQMGNSKAERSLHDAWSPALTGEGRQP